MIGESAEKTETHHSVGVYPEGCCFPDFPAAHDYGSTVSRDAPRAQPVAENFSVRLWLLEDAVLLFATTFYQQISILDPPMCWAGTPFQAFFFRSKSWFRG